MPKNSLKLSLIIPVFNEELYLKRCLDSIAAQTDMPDEVIVVDNNCTDKSMEIAGKYPFLTVIHEPRQHQSFAQAAGFNKAKGEILGRIDGDSILPPDWVAKMKQAFVSSPGLVAITGGADPYDVPMKSMGSAIFHGYIYIAGLIAGHRLLWGANCAITNDGWQKIKDSVLLRPDIWEDYDMAFCLDQYGKVGYLAGNKVGVSFRAMHTTFAKHVSYQLRSVRTFYLRANILRVSLFCVLWTSIFLVYPLAAFDDWLLKRRTDSNS